VPSRNFTVRSALVEGAVAASSADAPEEVTREPSATQSPLNSRRFSNLTSFLFAIHSFDCANRANPDPIVFVIVQDAIAMVSNGSVMTVIDNAEPVIDDVSRREQVRDGLGTSHDFDVIT
jgi:hypothetical protein